MYIQDHRLVGYRARPHAVPHCGNGTLPNDPRLRGSAGGLPFLAWTDPRASRRSWLCICHLTFRCPLCWAGERARALALGSCDDRYACPAARVEIADHFVHSQFRTGCNTTVHHAKKLPSVLAEFLFVVCGCVRWRMVAHCSSGGHGPAGWAGSFGLGPGSAHPPCSSYSWRRAVRHLWCPRHLRNTGHRGRCNARSHAA